MRVIIGWANFGPFHDADWTGFYSQLMLASSETGTNIYVEVTRLLRAWSPESYQTMSHGAGSSVSPGNEAKVEQHDAKPRDPLVNYQRRGEASHKERGCEVKSSSAVKRSERGV